MKELEVGGVVYLQFLYSLQNCSLAFKVSFFLTTSSGKMGLVRLFLAVSNPPSQFEEPVCRVGVLDALCEGRPGEGRGRAGVSLS